LKSHNSTKVNSSAICKKYKNQLIPARQRQDGVAMPIEESIYFCCLCCGKNSFPL
jgi:RNase P subunit RPR2